ncbi:MAG: hypothetical protein PHY21_04120, partial [Candidatus Cloacimonetes bacterium]|nr:hypothetical protein [Candidatus Cloacimonadota bacterium]
NTQEDSLWTDAFFSDIFPKEGHQIAFTAKKSQPKSGFLKSSYTVSTVSSEAQDDHKYLD